MRRAALVCAWCLVASVPAVQAIQIEGSSQLDSSAIEEVIVRYEHARKLIDLKRLNAELNRLYADRGFVNSGFLLVSSPGEEPRFRVVEGALTDIVVAGQGRLAQRYVSSRVQRHVSAPLNVDDLRYAIQLLQKDPNVVRVDAELLPSARAGESVLALSMDEPSRFEVTLAADNHRSASVGAEAGTVAVAARNLTGFGDFWQIGTALSDGIDEQNFSFSVPLTRWNTSVRAYYAKSNAEIVEARFEALDIESTSKTFGLAINQPVLESLKNVLSIDLALENKRSEEELLGMPFSFSPGAQNGRTETATVEVGVNWLQQSEGRALSTRLAYRIGTLALGATEFSPNSELERLLNVSGADGDFTTLVAQGTAIWRANQWPVFAGLNDRAQFVARFTGQIAQDPLMSLEKLAVGGRRSVRGFRENTLVRDNGVLFSVEAQMPIWGYRSDPHVRNLVVTAFVDAGWAWDETNTSPASQSRDTSDKRRIVSAGVGLLWRPLKGLSAQVQWGEDVSDNFDDDDPRDIETLDYDLQDDGLHFSLTYRLTF